jgi:TonB family protein
MLPEKLYVLEKPLSLFLLLSLLFHATVLLLPLSNPSAFRDVAERLVQVDLLPPPPVTEEAVGRPKELAEKKEDLPKQIVSPPDQVNEEEPDKARFLSDKDSATKEETVARGFPARSSPAPDPTPKTPAPQVEQPAKKSPPRQIARRTTPAPPAQKSPAGGPAGSPAEKPAEKPTLDSLANLKTSPWLNARDLRDLVKERNRKEEPSAPQGRDLIALAPPPATSRFLPAPSLFGTPDYLPDVRQGNLTLLNTKANRFAPFVRRVALRVFEHLIILQRRDLDPNNIVTAREMVRVDATLDLKGNLTGLSIQSRSGSSFVDAALLKACEIAAWDENPPPGAQSEDGNIHFIFRSRVSPRFGPDGSSVGIRSIIVYLEVGLV